MVKGSKRVVVGMSGGVDSSVAALLLKQQGFDVVGLFMKNWEEEGPCPAERDYEDVVAVCKQLDIAHYAVNFSKEYWQEVFSECLKGYQRGLTPNPDILCNREIKFKVFLDKALELGGDYLATGHYCQKVVYQNQWILGRGVDGDKDQSYFLYTLKSEILERVLFPLGGLLKPHVRQMAERAGLVTAQKKDSTGICFIGKRDFREFLQRYILPQPGHFETKEGRVVGTHEGIAFYTIGQRKGLGLGGSGEAWYVLGKDCERNVVIVDRGSEQAELFDDSLLAHEVSWVGAPPTLPYSCTAKVRYRSPDVACTISEEGNDSLVVQFDQPQKAITPGQSIVFYQGDLCLGGAIITSSSRSRMR